MKTYNVEFNGKYYGQVQGETEDEAEFSAALLVKSTGIRVVHRGFLFVTEA